MPLVQPRTTVDCSGLPVYDFSKLFNKEEIGKGAYGAVPTADYPFHGIDDKGQEFSFNLVYISCLVSMSEVNDDFFSRDIKTISVCIEILYDLVVNLKQSTTFPIGHCYLLIH